MEQLILDQKILYLVEITSGNAYNYCNRLQYWFRLTEIWEEKNSIWQGSFGSQHFNYAEYPEMFVVPMGYCTAAETKNITLV